MFFKIGVLKNFAIFIGKHVCVSLFLINPQLPVNIAKLLRTCFIKHLWLLLKHVLQVGLASRTRIIGSICFVGL